MTRYPFRYALWLRPLFTMLGMGPSASSIELDDRKLNVRMGPWFSATIDRSAIGGVKRDHDTFWAIGVHGWFGRWLVNASPRNTVTLTIDPPVRARAIGFPIKLRQLGLSPADPDALIAALRSQQG